MRDAWTTDRVLALAPDAASASAGQGLASARNWAGVGRSERAVWGLCQGSGKSPYQTRVDLSEPAFKCSCPSRKFPCKHGLGLMLLLAKEPASFAAEPEPGWVSEWLDGRAQRAEKKADRAETAPAAPADPEAQAKRAAKRDARVRDGVAECEVWLEDLLRRGLAATQSESQAFWDRAAARMVDAQAPGLAGAIRRIEQAISSGPGWDIRALDHAGRLHLLLRAAERLDELPPALAAEVRSQLGYTQAKESVLSGEGVADRWAVVGQVTELQDRLRVRRTWLVGRQTGSRALVLDFAAGAQAMDASLLAGIEFDGTLAFYEGDPPLRALVKERSAAESISTDLGPAADAELAQALGRYAGALARNPWLMQWPIVLGQAALARRADSWWIADRAGLDLPVAPRFAASERLWRLLAVCAGGPATIVAEWDGESALPLAAFTSDQRFQGVAQEIAA